MLDAIGLVSDRLVGGMMFHSDHADLMGLIGVKGLRKMHERGFRDDSHNMRKVRRACMSQLGKMPSHGNQERTKTLDSVVGRSNDNIGASERQRLVRSSMADWVKWESDTIAIYANACDKVAGNACLWELVRGLQADTERELARAKRLMQEFDACGYDMTHIYEM